MALGEFRRRSARVHGIVAIYEGGGERERGASEMGRDFMEGKRGKQCGAMMAQVRAV